MVKIFFENIEKSYYDNTKKELHLRNELILQGHEKELADVLEHETEHIRLDDKTLSRYDNRYLDFAYEWLIEKKFILWVILIPVSIYLQYWTNNYTLQQALNLCNAKLLNATALHPILFNLTHAIS